MGGWCRHYLLVFIRGMLMGAADVIPGVSGGTIAFITGIYERLVNALRAFSPAAFKLWWQQGFAAFWRHVDGTFLLSLFAGVIASILSLAHSITYLLDAYPLVVWGFFFGLIVASSVFVMREISPWSPRVLGMLALGIALALLVALLKPVQLPVNGLSIFLAGMIAICAMILPGISGSFLLLMMGFYPVFLQALVEVNITVLGIFISGCAVGLLAFSHLLAWLLRHYHRGTLALLSGFLVGSLVIVWPWKKVISTTLDRHGEEIPLVQENISPWHYQELMGDAQLWGVVSAALAGLLIVIILEYAASAIARRGKSKH